MKKQLHQDKIVTMNCYYIWPGMSHFYVFPPAFLILLQNIKQKNQTYFLCTLFSLTKNGIAQ